MPRSRDKAKRDYVRGWESASRRPYLYKNVPPTNQRKRLGLMLRLRELWERYRLGVLGVCCAILAVALVVLPADVRSESTESPVASAPDVPANCFGSQEGLGQDYHGCDLHSLNYSGREIQGGDFTGANLTDANFTGANLTDANFTDARLVKTRLWDANLTGANLQRAYLVNALLGGANFTGANLRGANLSGAFLDGTNFTGADLTGATLGGALWIGRANFTGATMPDGSVKP